MNEDLAGLLEAFGVVSMLGGGGGDVTDPLNIGYDPTTGTTTGTATRAQLGLPPKTSSTTIGGRINQMMAGPKDMVNTAYKVGNKALDNVATSQINAIRGALPAPVQGPLAVGQKLGTGQKAIRFAGQALKNPALKVGLKAAPVVGGALAVGDLVLGDESLANKGMDAALMGVGGVLGSAVPVVGTALGATAGKMVSDGVQWIFGDKKSPEERKMEEALLALRGGVV